jgi:hypothetical protein
MMLVLATLLPEMLEAQTRVPVFDATELREPTELGTIWLVHAGDDPSFAQPDFDDSKWTRFDSRLSIKKVVTGRPEVLWYRLHVKFAPDETGMALLEHQISRAFEVYLNGQRIIQSGQVAPFEPSTGVARIEKPIPDAIVKTGNMVIALRVHISRTEWDGDGPGFAAENLSLGKQGPLTEHLWLAVIVNDAVGWVISILGLGLAVVALALWFAQRQRLEYLWISLQFAPSAFLLPISLYETFHDVPVSLNLISHLLTMASVIFQILVFLAFLKAKPGRIGRILFVLAVVGLALSSIGQEQGVVSIGESVLIQIPLLILVSVVLPLALIVSWRTGNREAGILLIPIVLSCISIYMQVFIFVLYKVSATSELALRMGTLLASIKTGPFAVSLNEIGELLYIVSLAVIIVLRSTRMSRQQAVIAGELAAAQQVQQVLLPEKAETIPGFVVESVYEPAQQVGGDFFQILPTRDGGLLLVLGDVAGKGLPAAMLVSVMVGAIRTTASFSFAPDDMLSQLNERLIGRTNGAFSTALAAYITSDGNVTIANAGHLSPYLDGQEVELHPALPLGILSGAHYEKSYFQLAPGSRLTFYSDGVIEAKSTKGELFGFDRGREISTRPASAIAESAVRFGQTDDITVVAIQWLGSTAMASSAQAEGYPQGLPAQFGFPV